MTAHTMGFIAADRWLQALLTWTPGQTDMIKTVALVLMVTDHAGLLLAHNNEMMRLLGRGCFPLFGLAWGMNLARHAEIRQSQLNSLWVWALVAQVSFMLIGYPWYTGNILFAFAVTGQVLRWVSQPSWYYTLPAAGLLVAWIPLSTGSYGMAGVGMLTASWLLCRAQHAPERLGYGVLWALMVLLMNMNDVSESVAGLAIALLTLMVCSSAGERVKRFWPRQFFVMFYAVHLAVLGIVVSM
ncbi:MULTISPECIES: type-F conjugative transfer system pilin acetylase TraX [Klebsiella pneumoniae complex]|uniref:type-F conjugative transfer system pilin acetylase TraX n=1 Tax=Klebsiella pneumoniae complex TaxID=3390273 RepID=UPI00148CEB04|nr:MULTISPECIES: type-F conjugative transfer system pilin acetylase TraX [Klebsiella]MBL4371090.1 type-F conjugative transfer system pilin acetylase TraX [Klebsiella quasipneumoniae]MDI9090509.1 type-F conjugative transfer system pilin acetylase TraX [Klebsiella quasipneumoniae subsp. similipneumoniae]HEN5009437.1 type-F conjugative transfer system pilin acetylase TraX [Klebsiella quasipneumoniae subsp. similipneumoniae]HEN5290271.1 type-F conjugative transfer system pilin acetylase TraX [Klebs